MISISVRSFSAAHRQLIDKFHTAKQIHTDRWQGVDVSKVPAARMLELINVVVHLPQVPRTIENLARDLSASVNLPWAEDHFAERVCGQPINPGVEWANWPDGQSAAKFLDDQGKFNHNYMERYWPRYASQGPASRTPDEFQPTIEANRGIRGIYGDLEDLVQLLHGDPTTRQAYLPIFFPEDTALGPNERKPCTLGYQFILREGKLHIYYPMRSCDFYRHWGDDCYLTVRLAMWILDQLKQRDPTFWNDIEVGSYTMHCTSLHMFINDYLRIKQ